MRHPNGRGHVADEAEARPAAFIDPDSYVRDRARAHSGWLYSTTLALNVRFHNATAIRSVISCDEVTGGKIIESCLLDQCCIWDAPTLFRVTMRDGARVYGDAVMLGPLTLSGDMRVLAGTWHRAPRYQHLGFCFLTEGPPGHVMIDCKFNSYAAWFRVGDRFARRWYNWTSQQLAQVRAVLTEWEATEDLQGKHFGQCASACGHWD